MGLSEGQKKGIYLAIIVVVVLVIAYYLYEHFYAKCSTKHPCASGKVCSTQGKCIAPGSGAQGATCTADKDCASGNCATGGKCGFKNYTTGFRSGFNSDEMNWPTAGSIVLGDTYPFGNYSGYDVYTNALSYDPLYG